MTFLRRLLHVCVGCRHEDLYRERRTLHGVPVLHWVCADCDYAVPAIPRTADEHRQMVDRGAIRPMIARQMPQLVAVAERRFASQRRRARA